MKVAELRAQCLADAGELESVSLRVFDSSISIRSNSKRVLDGLRDYFRSYLVPSDASSQFEITAIECAPVKVPVDWTDWPREAGKSGLKERYADLSDGRLVWKTRTDMLFLLQEANALACGACFENLNQVINLVNNQYIAWVMNQGSQLCHAAGVSLNGNGLGLAGVSGAGKSTLALRLMERGASFVSNDRLLVQKDGSEVLMRGIPKQPRVNPGTLLSLPSLNGILSSRRAQELTELPQAELWELEEKYDVDIERVYGTDRWVEALGMRAFVVLTWNFNNSASCKIESTNLRARPELVEPIMKHPGPFFHEAGVYDTRGSVTALDPAPYIETLGDVEVVAISGGVDFPSALDVCLSILA